MFCNRPISRTPNYNFFFGKRKKTTERISDHTPDFLVFFCWGFFSLSPKSLKIIPPKSSAENHPPKKYQQINYHRKIIHKIFGFPLLLSFLLQAQTSHGVLVRVFTPPGIAVVKGDLWKHTTIGCFFVINSTPIWTNQIHMNQSGFNQGKVIGVLNVVHMVTFRGTKKNHTPRNGKAWKTYAKVPWEKGIC